MKFSFFSNTAHDAESKIDGDFKKQQMEVENFVEFKNLSNGYIVFSA
jgi:hypothetical protein